MNHQAWPISVLQSPLFQQTAPLIALFLIPAVVLLFTTYLRRLRLHSLVFRWIQSLRMGLESLGFSVWPWSSSSSRLAGASGGSPDQRRKKKSTGSSSSSKSKSVRTRAEQVALQQLGKQNDTASECQWVVWLGMPDFFVVGYDDEDARHYAGLVNISGTYCFMNSTLQASRSISVTGNTHSHYCTGHGVAQLSAAPYRCYPR